MSRKYSRTRGFTLIELMVALTVGILISGAVIAVFVTSKTTSRVGDALARYQESFRYASYVINRDVRMAGFFGCNSLSSTPAVMAKNMPAAAAYDGEAAVHGYDNSFPSGIPAIAGTDVLKLQFGSGGDYPLKENMSSADAEIRIAAPSGAFANGDYAVIANCGTTTIFKATSVSGGGVSDLVLSHDATGNAAFTEAYTTPSQVFKFVTTYYYLAAEEGRTVLKRKTFSNADGTGKDEEIAEGVDDLQLLYGIDTDAPSDRTANKYVKANRVADWSKVVSVRVCMLTRSLDDGLTTEPQKYYNCDGDEVTATDRRLHAPAFFTVTLRNRTI